jgi:hypothetical protein
MMPPIRLQSIAELIFSNISRSRGTAIFQTATNFCACVSLPPPPPPPPPLHADKALRMFILSFLEKSSWVKVF